MLRPARVTVLHNGVLVQDNVELSGPTGHHVRPPYKPTPEKLPLSLQDHGNPVRFRNIGFANWPKDSRRPLSRVPHPSFGLGGVFPGPIHGRCRRETDIKARPSGASTGTLVVVSNSSAHFP